MEDGRIAVREKLRMCEPPMRLTRTRILSRVALQRMCGEMANP
jgi:hypothetical protein